MTTQVQLPPDNRVTGQGNPPGDANLHTIALMAMSATSYCMPTTDATGASDPVNISAAVSANDVAVLGPGTYYMNATAGPFTTGQYVVCMPGVTVNWLGTGDCFRWVDSSTYTSRTGTGGGLLGRPVIDGTGAGAGSTGLHYGDILQFRYDVAVQNFSGAGSIGILADNQNYWTEETFGRFYLSNCAQHLVFNTGGATTSTNSFGYGDLAGHILAKANQDGVVLQNGALLYNASARIRGNFQGTSATNTSAVLRITGTVPAGHPNAGGGSAIHSCRLDLMAECTSATGANAPQTIAFGTLSTNQLLGCYGGMDFAQGTLAFAVSNWTATGAAGTFGFDGPIRGDFNLNNSTVGLSSTYSFATAGARVFGKSLLSATSGNMQVDNGDFFQVTLSQNITVNLNPGGAAALAGAQRKTIVATQAASGGPFTITWPKPGSPSTTSCAVYWPGGTAPAMSAGAGAVDVYNLITYDGVHWYGEALQAMS